MARVTIYQVAKEAGVSTATVSRALQSSRLLSPDVVERVTTVANTLGYARRAIRRPRERAILNLRLVLPVPPEPERRLFYDFAELAEGLQSGLAPCAVSLVCELNVPGYNPFPHKKGGDVDGFVFAFHQPDARVQRLLRKHGKPFVVLNRSGDPARCVAVDHAAGFAALVKHLGQSKSLLQPVFVGLEGLGEIQDDRLAAFIAACAAQNVAFEPARDTHFLPNLTTPDPALFRRWQAAGCNALVAVNDLVGATLLADLAQAGLSVPKHFAVTGFDDSPVRRLTRPLLTTVSMPVRELGAEAGRRLFAEIVEKTPLAPAKALAGTLLIGGSTGG